MCVLLLVSTADIRTERLRVLLKAPTAVTLWLVAEKYVGSTADYSFVDGRSYSVGLTETEGSRGCCLVPKSQRNLCCTACMGHPLQNVVAV